jgi:hypothetical protein
MVLIKEMLFACLCFVLMLSMRLFPDAVKLAVGEQQTAAAGFWLLASG